MSNRILAALCLFLATSSVATETNVLKEKQRLMIRSSREQANHETSEAKVKKLTELYGEVMCEYHRKKFGRVTFVGGAELKVIEGKGTYQAIEVAYVSEAGWGHREKTLNLYDLGEVPTNSELVGQLSCATLTVFSIVRWLSKGDVSIPVSGALSLLALTAELVSWIPPDMNKPHNFAMPILVKELWCRD